MFFWFGVERALNEEQAAPATPGSLRTSPGKAPLQGAKIETIRLLSMAPRPRSRAYRVWR